MNATIEQLFCGYLLHDVDSTEIIEYTYNPKLFSLITSITLYNDGSGVQYNNEGVCTYVTIINSWGGSIHLMVPKNESITFDTPFATPSFYIYTDGFGQDIACIVSGIRNLTTDNNKLNMFPSFPPVSKFISDYPVFVKNIFLLVEGYEFTEGDVIVKYAIDGNIYSINYDIYDRLYLPQTQVIPIKAELKTFEVLEVSSPLYIENVKISFTYANFKGL